MGFLTTLNLVNPDAFIVRQNVARYWAAGDLDADYLESLSADAVPALVGVIAATEGVEWQINPLPCPSKTGDGFQETCETELTRILQKGLIARFQDMRDDSSWRPWQSFRLSTWRAYRLLSRTYT
jgi:hypothetical protein